MPHPKRLPLPALLVFASWTAAFAADTMSQAEAQLDEGFSGVIVATMGNETVYARAFGYADRESRVRNELDHQFRIGSLTKTFTAALLFALTDIGVVSADEPVATFVDGVPNGSEITLRMLAEHESGLRDWKQKDWRLLLLHETDLDDAGVQDMIREKSAKSKPGEKFDYNNAGYMLLGYALEELTGLTLQSAIQREILEPLELHQTGFAALDKEIPSLSKGYNDKDPDDNVEYDYHLIRAAGGMYSTASDLVAWCRAIQDGKNQLSTYRDRMPGWRSGTRFGRKAYWHTGNTNTHSALLVLFPEVRGCYVALSNVGRKKPPRALMRTLPELIFKASVPVATKPGNPSQCTDAQCASVATIVSTS